MKSDLEHKLVRELIVTLEAQKARDERIATLGATVDTCAEELTKAKARIHELEKWPTVLKHDSTKWDPMR